MGNLIVHNKPDKSIPQKAQIDLFWDRIRHGDVDALEKLFEDHGALAFHLLSMDQMIKMTDDTQIRVTEINALTAATCKSSHAVLALLISHQFPLHPNSRSETALHVAAMRGDHVKIGMLVAAYSSPEVDDVKEDKEVKFDPRNSRTATGETPFDLWLRYVRRQQDATTPQPSLDPEVVESTKQLLDSKFPQPFRILDNTKKTADRAVNTRWHVPRTMDMILLTQGTVGHEFLAFVYPPEQRAESVFRIFTLDLFLDQDNNELLRFGGPGENLRGALGGTGGKYTIKSRVRLTNVSMNSAFFASEIVMSGFGSYHRWFNNCKHFAVSTFQALAALYGSSEEPNWVELGRLLADTESTSAIDRIQLTSITTNGRPGAGDLSSGAVGSSLGIVGSSSAAAGPSSSQAAGQALQPDRWSRMSALDRPISDAALPTATSSSSLPRSLGGNVVTVDHNVVFEDRRELFDGIDYDWPREEIHIALRKSSHIRYVNIMWKVRRAAGQPDVYRIFRIEMIRSETHPHPTFTIMGPFPDVDDDELIGAVVLKPIPSSETLYIPSPEALAADSQDRRRLSFSNIIFIAQILICKQQQWNWREAKQCADFATEFFATLRHLYAFGSPDCPLAEITNLLSNHKDFDGKTIMDLRSYVPGASPSSSSH